MGLFDKVMGPKEPEKLTKEEAFAAVGLAAIAADGVITEEEGRGFLVGLYRMKMYRNFNQNQMGNLLNKLINIVQRQGFDALIKLANEGLPAELKESAFAVATDLVFADGDVDVSEQQVMTKIQQMMGIPEAQAMKIIEVMSIKNMG
jgi:tellurite resistance protein